ncbi:T9SS type A sorting domain-containing protein [Flavobacterium sp. ov086]|uniref:T9SS type A sorting domain-containing protein n=1 Tax=Flavobacterium sp. ov086 TaxID=1761785 RepID=UPI000B639BFC|nr:T9SS type A sorting domain-containing protein [Flavobacterium sp. ov086]SNR79825.1 Por secretion system C-terminal sorting domain-containing protein [Flavobacterium sp. ov086]
MKKYLPFIFLLFPVLASAQTKLTFSYDAAGNQILRELCLSGCSPTAKPAKEVKEIEAITKDDLLKFSPQDVISYYPNPVKEELYLQWQLANDNHVTSIMVYSVTGQMLQMYQVNERTDSLNIPFQPYSTGVYLVLLSYKDGGEKSIKIIKQ